MTNLPELEFGGSSCKARMPWRTMLTRPMSADTIEMPCFLCGWSSTVLPGGPEAGTGSTDWATEKKCSGKWSSSTTQKHNRTVFTQLLCDMSQPWGFSVQQWEKQNVLFPPSPYFSSNQFKRLSFRTEHTIFIYIYWKYAQLYCKHLDGLVFNWKWLKQGCALNLHFHSLNDIIFDFKILKH